MAASGNSRENPLGMEVIHDETPPDLDPKGSTDPKVLVKSTFASPEALNLLRLAFTSNSVGASDSVGALKAPVTDQPHIMQARVLKTQETARTKVNTMSADAEGIGSEAEQPAVKTPIKFQEFFKRKSKSRKEHLKPKSTRKVERDVSIDIGIMTARGKSHKLSKTLILCWLPSNIEDKTWRSQ
ncbi:hypothetical protein AWC38_SpisGene22413 [Stylophora pistillata]|uniref:Uncharacterized protein n=1 Tax=Stylophora pistillata TaxID=50429 RepID=A0A2B4R8M1_STYPI|nr:hypothetical protein AWC38_SpisGene22413 [Stylophora pistillata]